MKTTSIADFRSHIAELVDGSEPVLVTKNGKNAALVYPLNDPDKIPANIKRELFRDLAAGIASQLGAAVTDDEIERDFTRYQKRRRR